MQSAQNQMLAWQVVSQQNPVPPQSAGGTTVSYQTPSIQQPSVLTSTALVMPYGTGRAAPGMSAPPAGMSGPGINASLFSNQRIIPQQQQPQMNLVINQPTQNQTSMLNQPGGVFSMLQPDQLRGAAAAAGNEQRGLLSHSPHPPHMSSSGNQLPLMMGAQQQMMGGHQLDENGQRSDLTKHVNAKPFEPTSSSRTPPLMQSPPVMQSQPIYPTQHLSAPQQQQTSQQSSTQSYMHSQLPRQPFSSSSAGSQQQQQNHSHSHSHQQSHQTGQQPHTLVASVRPRSIQNRNMTSPSPPTSGLPHNNNLHQNGPASHHQQPQQQPSATGSASGMRTVSPIDPSLAMIASVLGYKSQGAMTQSMQQAAQQQQHRFHHPSSAGPSQLPQMPQAPAAPTRQYSVRPTSHQMQQQNSRPRISAPGPIQRPTHLLANPPSVIGAPPQRSSSHTSNHHVPSLLSATKSNSAPAISATPQSAVAAPQTVFHSLERQRMIEETKRYFQTPAGGSSTSVPTTINSTLTGSSTQNGQLIAPGILKEKPPSVLLVPSVSLDALTSTANASVTKEHVAKMSISTTR